MTRIKRKTITDSVGDEIREMIISGEIKGGQPLRQELLAARFGCSLIPVREALLNLQGEGLVDFVSHKGAVVKSISIGEVDEIFSLRALLECDILERAIPHITEADFSKADAVLEQFCQLLEPDSKLQNWGKLNWAFHRIFYEPANRPYTLQIIGRLHTSCDRYIMLQIQLDEGRTQAHAEHVDFLKRVRGKEVHGAIKALREHILITGERLVDGLTASGFFDKN
ncbi:MAG: GntR family transcriptional regulator [Rhodospirillales bacterium]|nr:GntR family transcriptional regulator [Rhodospirillales bacterium]